MEKSFVRIHGSVESCCTSEFGWMNVDLCIARSSLTTSEKYWPAMANSICVKDSHNPAQDLSVQLFDTVAECCMSEIFWKTENACAVSSAGEGNEEAVVTGSNKFYVDMVKQQCVKDCVGSAPCGGLAHAWDSLYDSESECTKFVPWIL